MSRYKVIVWPCRQGKSILSDARATKIMNDVFSTGGPSMMVTTSQVYEAIMDELHRCQKTDPMYYRRLEEQKRCRRRHYPR